ncbi:nuclear transport factor 2 family protein [Paraburkholderia aromaticivorans]|uniref:nuclear transport factor 2 family protein n=1 Tax=Paraburkholderia aromaticivorans TaxID=2026199 RepID=UPI001455F120|nr:nuclear transport factor 2 family protein [Paraburkholderia aromaticivorans]
MAASTLARRIARLEAIEEVNQLIGRYAQGADRQNDPALMAPLFSRDAIWEARGFGRYEGRDEVARELARIGEEQIVWSLHYMTAPVVEIDADLLQGRARWHLWELAQVREPHDGAAPPAAHWMGGEYDTRVVLEEGRWYFASVLLDMRLIHRHDAAWFPRGRTGRTA